MRLTAPELAAAYRDGMTSEGATVLDAGEVGTEVLYYLVGSRDLDGGLMCTASHNPKPYTGAKLVGRGALALSGDAGIGDVRDRIEAGLGDAPGGGAVEQVSMIDEFREAALRFIDADAVRPLKVVVDGGNGMAGPMVGPLLERLGLELFEAYWTPDGNFPDHEPNPMLPENREFIMAEVVRRGADLGIAWDGDADRCFFIDEQGAFVDGDFLTALMSASIIDKEPGATVLYDVRASRAVADTARESGGRALVNRVGHAFFKTRMREENAVFGGEVSGHYYFRDFYCADSGTLPALLILELLSRRGAGMSELLEPYRSRYFISGEINSEVSDPDGKLEELAERYNDGDRVEARRGQRRLRRLALQRACVQHRAAAAAVRRVVALPRGHGVPPRRAAERDPLVTGADPAAADVDPGAAQAAAGLALAADAGIHRLAVPTPFLVGRVNCYLIEDRPLTLVDTGPNSGKSLDELEQALGALGHRVEELELIVITHQHMDHLGLLEILSRRSGAEVAALDLLTAYLSNFSASAAQDDEFAMGVMRRHGVPGDLATALSSVGASFRAFGSSGQVTRPLRDGDRLEFDDRTLEVLHRPGHSPSDTIFWDRERASLIAGDHLLAHISSNPLVSRPLGDADRGHRAPARADPVHRLDARDAGAAGEAGPARARRPSHRPRGADRRAAADARAARAQARSGCSPTGR